MQMMKITSMNRSGPKGTEEHTEAIRVMTVLIHDSNAPTLLKTIDSLLERVSLVHDLDSRREISLQRTLGFFY